MTERLSYCVTWGLTVCGGIVGFQADVVQALKELRRGEGVTPARLEAHPLLMQLLQAETGSDGVKRLTELCDQLDGDDHRAALKNALALDYPALSGPEERRRVRTTHPAGGTADFPFSPRTLRRREDEGMELLAQMLLTMPETEAPEEHTVDPSEAWPSNEHDRQWWAEVTERATQERRAWQKEMRPYRIRTAIKWSPVALVCLAAIFFAGYVFAPSHSSQHTPSSRPSVSSTQASASEARDEYVRCRSALDATLVLAQRQGRRSLTASEKARFKECIGVSPTATP